MEATSGWGRKVGKGMGDLDNEYKVIDRMNSSDVLLHSSMTIVNNNLLHISI
jgi:hypothetical protein